MNKIASLAKGILNTFNVKQIQNKVPLHTQAEKQIFQLNRLYATVSQINQTIVHVQDRETLFHEICNVAVNHGQFHMAWIGMINGTREFIKPVAFAGNEQGYLTNVNISLSGDELGRGPTGEAIYKGHCVFCQDIATDPRMIPWRDEALKRGFRASAAVPIRQNARVIGAFMVYAAESLIFDTKELQLLEEIGLDISFALDMIERENQRNLATVALQKSEERFRSTLDNMKEGCQIIGFDWRYLYINNAADIHNRRPKEDLLGNKYMDMWPDIETTKVFHIIKQCMEERVHHHTENEFVFPDGTAGWFDLNIEPVPDGVLLLSIDITESKKAKEELLASERRLHELLENVNLIAILLDVSGKVSFCNPFLLSLTGYTHKEMMGCDWFEQMVPGDQSEKEVFLNSLKSGKIAEHFEKPIITKNGEVRHIFWNNTILRNADGSVNGSARIGEDITERKKAIEKLKKSEARLKKGEEIGHLGYWQQEIGGYFIWASEEAKKIYGFPPVAGELPKDIVAACIRDIELVRQAANDLTKNNKKYEIEFSIDPADGSPRKIVSSVAELERDKNGKPVRLMGVLQDITKRKQAEQALRESEANLKKSQEIAKLGSWVLDLNGKLTCSEELYRIYGISPKTSDLDVEQFISIIHQEDQNEMQRWITACVTRENPGEIIFRIIGPDETIRFMSSLGELIYDNDGNPLYMSGTTQDITERKLAEENEKKYSQRMINILESINDAFVSLDTNWCYTYVNNKAGELLKRIPEEIIGKHIWTEFPDVVDLPFYHKYYLAVETQQPQFIEEYYQAYDRWYENYIYPGAEGLSIFFHDVTERKKTEEEIKKNNDELLTINRITNTCTGVLNIKEILDNVLTEALNIVGLEGGTICLVEPDDTLKLISHRGTSDATINDLAKGKVKVGNCLCGSCAHDNCPLILRNREEVLEYATTETLRGENIHFHAAFPLTSKEKCVGVLCIFTRTGKKPENRSLKLLETLTAQVALAIENAQLFTELEERVSKRTSQLSSSNKELESFSYSISHDLRAPLRAIYGFSQILAERHRETLNEEGKQYMDYIVQASVRMEQLINDLLDYSRLGRKALKMQPVSLKDIIDATYSDFIVQLKEAGGEFIINDELPQILGEKSLLRQIFTNLLSNAITYRRNDVPLKISMSCESIAEGYLLKFTDNGIGIHKEYWDKIFNVFQRLHNEEKYPGTGIGLATVKKAATLLGATVSVESTVGKGSTFFIKFPKYKI